MQPNFSEPLDDDYRMLARNWQAIANLVREEYHAELDQSPASLDLLQRIRDDDLVGDEGYGYGITSPAAPTSGWSRWRWTHRL
jgi:hypothetical protein